MKLLLAEVGYKQHHSERKDLCTAVEYFTGGVAILMSWFSMDVHREGRDFDNIFVTSYIIPKIRHRLQNVVQYKDIKPIEVPPNLRRRFSLGPALLKQSSDEPKQRKENCTISQPIASESIAPVSSNTNVRVASPTEPTVAIDYDDDDYEPNEQIETIDLDQYGTASLEVVQSSIQQNDDAALKLHVDEVLRAAKDQASAEVSVGLSPLNTVSEQKSSKVI